MNYFLPPILIVFGLVLYQVSQKSVDQDANPFVAITIAYIIGIFACLVGFLLVPREGDASLIPMIKTISWSALGIGIGAAAIEIGFLLAYRNGWSVSILPVLVTVCSVILMIAIGIIAYRENLSIEKIAGILLCIGGLVLITIKK